MATLYEYYITGDDGEDERFGALWGAQTFTPAISHTITSVKIKLFRVGSPGDVTVSIRATDGSGHPTGGDLGDTGTTNGNTLTTDGAGEWREITLGNYSLDASIKYAIVVRATGGDSSNKIKWRRDSSSPTYSGGNYVTSSNSGSSWLNRTDDAMFEEWGEAIVVASTVTTQAVTDIGFD